MSPDVNKIELPFLRGQRIHTCTKLRVLRGFGSSSVLGWEKNARAGAVGLGNDPDARPIRQPIRRQDAESFGNAQLVLRYVRWRQITRIETEVFNEKNQRVIAAGFECCCRSGCHHDMPSGKRRSFIS